MKIADGDFKVVSSPLIASQNSQMIPPPVMAFEDTGALIQSIETPSDVTTVGKPSVTLANSSSATQINEKRQGFYLSQKLH